MLDAGLRVAQPIQRGQAGFLEILRTLETDRVFERLGPALGAAYRAFVQRESHRLEALRHAPACLVHSDFDPSNILVRRVDGRWTVSGVLDWEFAHSGSPLEDLGHLLRPPAGAVPGFQEGLVKGYTDAGGQLPPGWRGMASLLDLTAFVAFLARPGAGPEVIRAARHAVRNTLQTWDSPSQTGKACRFGSEP